MGCSNAKIATDSFTSVHNSFWNIKVVDNQNHELVMANYKDKKVFLVINLPANSNIFLYSKKYLRLLQDIQYCVKDFCNI